MFRYICCIALFFVTATGHATGRKPAPGRGGGGVSAGLPFPQLTVQKLIVMPSTDGHADWIEQIQSARQSIHLTIYHLTDATVIQALLSKAKSVGKDFDLRIIVDGKSMTGGYQKALQPLVDAGVQLKGSSPAFSIMHEKAMVVDGATAIISAINLTNTSSNTRDYGVMTDNSEVIAEMNSVFEADWQNALNGTGDTPALSNENLAWSPVNSGDKLIKFIDSATGSLVMNVESLSLPDLISAFSRAAQRGVTVQVIVPECVLGDALFDYPALDKLTAAGVQTHVMPAPSSFDQPYMHSKMMVADGQNIYVGSINFSANSVQMARELGLLFNNSFVASEILTQFNQDWARSVVPSTHPSCARTPSEEDELVTWPAKTFGGQWGLSPIHS